MKITKTISGIGKLVDKPAGTRIELLVQAREYVSETQFVEILLNLEQLQY